MPWFLAAAAACTLFSAAAFGTFVPLRDAGGIEYLFAWPGAAVLATRSLIALSGLAALYAGVRRVGRGVPAHSDDARSGRWLAPLTALACVMLGVLPAVPGVGEYGAPAMYFFYDLRWWWLAALCGWTLVRADAAVGGRIFDRFRHPAAWRAPARLLFLEGLLVVTVVAWAVATTPNLRFSGLLHGDEPKYLRYCEVWYQGGGFDISQKTSLSDQPVDAPPRLGRTFAGLVRASLEEVQAFGFDLRQFAANPRGFHWNRTTGRDGFVDGKHGGLYQIYQPGLSAVLFPGYFIDRYLLAFDPGYNAEFPDELAMTNLAMLLMYAACAGALFRLLRNALGDDYLAAIWAAIAAMTLPTTAFAFQLYTEIPAAVAIIAVTNYLLFTQGSSSPPWTAAAAGAAAAAISWLHPRFLLVSLCLAAVAVLRTRAGPRRLFMGAFGMVLLSVMAFDYRVTGSWLPTAMWDAALPEGTLRLSAVPLNLGGYAIDRRWGLLPHAVILIAWLPGLALLAQRAKWQATVLVALGLALAIPAAGHSISAAGGTPGRLVLAVVPLAVWPIAILVRELWASAASRVIAVVCVILSLDAGFAYNWSHEKHLGTIRDASLSGWKPNLAFPGLRDDLWRSSNSNFVLFLVLLGIVVALSWLAFFHAGRRATSTRAARATRVWIAPAIVLAMTAFASVATAANGAWYDGNYMIDDASARRAAAGALVALSRCAVCFSSRSPAIDWMRLEPNGARGVRLDVVAVQDLTIAARVRVEAPDPATGFGRTRVDFGDEESRPWSGIVSETTFRHTYRRPGPYVLTAWLQLRDGSVRMDRARITIK